MATIRNRPGVLGSVLALLFLSGCYTDSPRLDPCCGGGQVPASYDQPKTILTHDFGMVKKKQTLQHTFVIHNPSPKEIRFEREPDIGFPCCVKIETTADVIPPGGSVDLNVTFETEQRPGPFDVFIRTFPDSDEVPSHIHIGGLVKGSD